MFVWGDESHIVHGDDRPLRPLTGEAALAGVLLIAGAFALATLVAGVLVSGVQ